MAEPDLDSGQQKNEPVLQKKKNTKNHSFLKRFLWCFGSLIAFILLILSSMMVYLNTQNGKNYLAAHIGVWTGHAVDVKGISGSFPNHLRVDEITLNSGSSVKTPWLILKKIQLDWSMASLMNRTLSIKNLSAQEVRLESLPQTSEESATTDHSPSKSPFLTLSAFIHSLKIDKLHLSKNIISTAVDLNVEGKASTSNLLSFFDTLTLNSIPDFTLELNGKELNHATQFNLQTTVNKHQILKGALSFSAQSNAAGMVERLLTSDQLTPLSINFSFNGPFDQLQTQLNLETRQTYLKEKGYFDFYHAKMGITLLGHSPAMTLNQNIHWDSWDLNAQLKGSFTKPTGQGKFSLVNLAFNNIFLNQLRADFSSQDLDPVNRNQWARLHLVADGLRVPGQASMLFAKDPVLLDVLYSSNMADRPVEFWLRHRIVKAIGQLYLKPSLHGSVDLALPNLGELAALKGVDLEGWSALNFAFEMPETAGKPVLLDVDGPIVIKKGLPIAVNMIGPQGHIGIHARIFQKQNPDVRLDDLFLKGQHVCLQGRGDLFDQKINGSVHLAANDLSALTPLLKGKGDATLKVDGLLKDMNLQLEMKTGFQTVSNHDYSIAPSDLMLKVDVAHLFSFPQLTMLLNGTLDRSPVNMQLLAQQKKDINQYLITLKTLNWRSLTGQANLTVSDKNFVPNGNLNLKIARLADFRNILRQNIEGNLGIQVHTLSKENDKLSVNLDSKLNMPGMKFNKLVLSGYVDHTIKKPDVNLKAQISELELPQVKGNMRFNAAGTMDNLKLTGNADFPLLMQSKGSLDTALLLDIERKKLNLQKLNALVKGENIHLISPVRVDFGGKMAVDHLRLMFAPLGEPSAVIDLAGTIKPTLGLNASIQNVTPAVLKPFMPNLQAQGMLNAQARLKGTIEKPTGIIQINARNVKMLTGEAASLPVAQLSSQTNLLGTNGQTHTQLQMGDKLNLDVNGLVPFNLNGKMALNIHGYTNLGLANAIIGAYGQQVKGNVNLAMQVNGNYRSPHMTGTLQLLNGSFRDYAQGVSVQNIQAMLVGENDHIRLELLTAKAGSGDIHADGKVGLFQPGIPVDLHLNMKNARPLVSDLLTAILDGDIHIEGMAKSRLDIKGLINIKHAEINIPHSISSSVVPLKVIRPGEKPETEKSKNSLGPILNLDLTLKSAGEILVRGFGLFTNMAGSLHITGTSDAPTVAGGMKMQNGHIDLSGISLDFTRGVIGFHGSNVDRKIDPSLDFEVKKTVEGNTARLLISGFASAPKITLTSSPPLSQDRILALLLFGVDSQSLSATQMAEIGLALATLGGQTAGIDPLGTVRKSLGLDRLSLGGGSRTNENGGSNNGASVAAGKYVAKGVYIGAKQSTGNAGTQAEMQIDITKHLKATAAVGTGKDNSRFITPDNDPGSNVGLLYEFDY